MNTLSDQRRPTPTARQCREGRILEVTSAGAFYELDAEPNVRKGPARIPITGTPAAATGDRVAVQELDSGTPLIVGRWRP